MVGKSYHNNPIDSNIFGRLHKTPESGERKVRFRHRQTIKKTARRRFLSVTLSAALIYITLSDNVVFNKSEPVCDIIKQQGRCQILIEYLL